MKTLPSILAAIIVSFTIAGASFAGSAAPPEVPSKAPSKPPAGKEAVKEAPGAPIPPDPAALDFVLRRLQNRYDSISTLSAAFTQEFHPAGFEGPRTSGGRVYFKKPGKMHWVYLSGSRDILVSDGATMWLYQPDLRQVVKTPASTGSSIATDYLSGLGDIRRDFFVVLKEERDKSYVLELTPVAPQPNVSKVFLEVDKLKTLVYRSTVEDFFGNRTVVTFKNIDINAPLDEELFTFTPPAGITVVDQ